MQPDRESPLQERLLALLEGWAAHSLAPHGLERDDDAPVADGLDALRAAPAADEEPTAAPAPAPADAGPVDPCLRDVQDAEALRWAALAPGAGAVAELGALFTRLTVDVEAACRPVEPATTLPEVVAPDAVPDAVSDAVLVEAVAAAERCLAHVTGLRDVAVGVLARRRQSEAEADVAAARAATARDGVGRPWAKVARSTAPTELAARLGVSARQAGDLLERGTAALQTHRGVGEAMRCGALSPALGSWLLDELVGLRAATETTSFERERAQRTASLEARRAQEDGERAAAGLPAPSAAETRARSLADVAAVDADAEAAARRHAEDVTARVREELLGRATGTDGTAGGNGNTGRPGLGDTREKWRRQLARSVARVDPEGAAARAQAKRAQRSVSRWSEADGQACLQLRGPAEDVALVGTAMDARAKRRRQQARDAEHAAAREQGRPFDRSAVGSLDAHRFEAVKEWAVAALELAGTSGVSGTWYPVARTAASRPAVSIVMPVTVALGVTTVGAFLAGYGPLGAEAARRVAGDGFWRRVFSDPPTGVAVGVEEKTYRPGTATRRLVGLRHPTSTMPGSSAAADGCDLDHIEPWRDDGGGGATTVENLHPLAEGEHLLKQAGDHAPPGHGWRVVPGPPGVGGVVWLAPTGHTYPVPPQQWEPQPPGWADGPRLADAAGWASEPLAGWLDDGDGAPPDWSSMAFVDDPPADPVEDPAHDDGTLSLRSDGPGAA